MSNENEEELSLQDEVKAAMAEVEAKDEPNEPEVKEPEVKAPEAKEPEVKEPEVKEPEVKEPEVKEPLLTEDKAPSGWSPAAREKWITLPKDIRQEIVRREEASAVGVRQLQERYAPLENFVSGLMPYIQEASGLGVNPQQYISSVMQSERVLRSADVPTKFQELLRIADQYGIPLRDVINESVGAQVLAKPAPAANGHASLPPELQQELNEMRQWRQQQEEGGVNQQIMEFAKDKEFFNDVHLTMAAMFDAGKVTTLQEAYDAACRADPQIYKIMQDREALKKSQDAAAGASVKPNGTVDPGAGEADPDDLQALVRQEWNKATTGRV